MTYELWVKLWVLIFPIGYHWECICTLRMRITWPMTSIFPTYLKLLTPICLSLSNLYRCMIKINWVIPQNSLWFYVKDHIDPHAQHHVSLERRHKSISMIVLGNHSFLLLALNFGNLATFRAIFSHIFTAHAQKWPFMSFQFKFWHRHSILWPWFSYREWYFGNLKTFSDDFCIRYAECPPYFYFSLYYSSYGIVVNLALVWQLISLFIIDNKRLLVVVLCVHCCTLQLSCVAGCCLLRCIYEAVIAAYDGNKFVVKYEASTNNCEPQKTCYTWVTVCF